ncbi:MAG: hypothetical protein IPL32_15165 [Chloracidobacterium sp.]|nr:hypothetical protein [Chloracidobacterium sp.]
MEDNDQLMIGKNTNIDQNSPKSSDENNLWTTWYSFVLIVFFCFAFSLNFWLKNVLLMVFGESIAIDTISYVISHLGEFLALVVGVHLIYHFFFARHEQNIFISNMRSQLEGTTKKFGDSLQDASKSLDAINQSVGKLDGAILKIEYMKVHELIDQANQEKTQIYEKAIDEIKKCEHSIDIFTSYLSEANCDDNGVENARKEYFKSLENLVENPPPNKDFKYRRIVQAKTVEDLWTDFSNESPYKSHIEKIRNMEKGGHPCSIGLMSRRRPTTYVIIDKKVLLWQINQVEEDGKMDLYGMFIVQDPQRILIEHFSEEFDNCWDKKSSTLP